LFALSQLARPPAGSASIDVLASDAVATKGLAAIFVPFVADTFSPLEGVASVPSRCGPASYPRVLRCCAAFAKIDGTEAREAEKLRGPHTMPLSRAFEILELLIGRITDNT